MGMGPLWAPDAVLSSRAEALEAEFRVEHVVGTVVAEQAWRILEYTISVQCMCRLCVTYK